MRRGKTGQNKNAPSGSGRLAKTRKLAGKKGLRLPLWLGSRRGRGFRRGGLRRWGLRCGRGATLERVGLVVEPDDVLRHVDLVRGVENRCILRRRIQHEDVAVFAGVAVENIDHLAADLVDD